MPHEDDLPAPMDLGLPGEYPYTRGVHREMYRKQLWTMRQYAGYASAKESTSATSTCSSTARPA